MKRLERDTNKEIVKWLQGQGCKAWRNNSGQYNMGGRHIKGGEKGMPDIMAILPNGMFMAIENKSNGAVVSEEQTAWLKDAARHKAHVVVALKGLGSVVEYFESVIFKARNHV